MLVRESIPLKTCLREHEGIALGQQRVALAISLILKLLENHASECGDIIVVHTNMGAFARYVEKDCYPSGLRRRQYIQSILIHPLLCKPQAGSDGEKDEVINVSGQNLNISKIYFSILSPETIAQNWG